MVQYVPLRQSTDNVKQTICVKPYENPCIESLETYFYNLSFLLQIEIYQFYYEKKYYCKDLTYRKAVSWYIFQKLDLVAIANAAVNAYIEPLKS